MDFEKEDEFLNKLLEYCKDFNNIISTNMIYNLNDGVNIPEMIDKKNAKWRTFINDMNTYLTLYSNQNRKEEFEKYVSSPVINSDCIADIEVFINSLKNELIINSKSKNVNKNNKLYMIIKKTPEIEQCFRVVGGNGMPKINVLKGNETFEKWRASLKYELQQINNDDFISELLQLIDSFNSWNDKTVYKELVAKLCVLEKNIDRYIVKDKENTEMSNNKVFIVHGRDIKLRNEVELFVRRIGLEPIILSEQASQGMTIIEKIEANRDVCFSIVLYTACDEGRLKSKGDLKDRARQNVVFEHGYMVAHLGRKNVVALTEENIEIPGDLDGVIYISINDEWQHRVMVEMDAAKLKFNWSKA